MDDTPTFFSYKDPNAPPNAGGLLVRFVQESHQNKQLTDASGIATFDNVLIALVSCPGLTKTETASEIERIHPDGTVKQHSVYARKYAEQVKLYKAGATMAELGTPLREIPGITAAMIANMRARGIHTIEMLAEANEGGSADLMGFFDYREKARKYIGLREKEAPAKHLAAELLKRDDEIAALKRQIQEIAALTPKRGAGRPPKAVEQEAA